MQMIVPTGSVRLVGLKKKCQIEFVAARGAEDYLTTGIISSDWHCLQQPTILLSTIGRQALMSQGEPKVMSRTLGRRT